MSLPTITVWLLMTVVGGREPISHDPRMFPTQQSCESAADQIVSQKWRWGVYREERGRSVLDGKVAQHDPPWAFGALCVKAEVVR